MSKVESAALLERWDKGGRTSWSGRLFSLVMLPFGYPKLEGGMVIEAYRGPAAFSSTCKVGEDEWKREFDAWDRAASRAASRHRDRVVLLHLLAALAVLTAVLGAIDLLNMSLTWAAAETVILSIIVFGLVMPDRRPESSVHHAWLVLRKQAEAFRTRALMRPFEGPLAPPDNARKATLLALLDDQIEYQNKAHERWEKLHLGLEKGTRWIFYGVFAAVLGHLVSVLAPAAHFFHSPNWLIITAAGPAFAACLHGIAGKLEVKRLASQAEAMSILLSRRRAEVMSLNVSASGPELRELAKKISEELSAEHDTWVSLLEDGRLQEPA